MKYSPVLLCLASFLLAACGAQPLKPSDQYIQQSPTAAAQAGGTIPQPIRHAVVLPPPKPVAKVETYSVVVTNLQVREILFALARDAKINIDIHSGIDGVVTLNAINQTLPQILDRISKQVDIRYKLNDGSLIVEPDKPFLKTYKIDFINMSRTATSNNSTSSQISGGTATSGGNSGSTSVTSESKNNLMESLIANVTAIINEEDKLRFKSAVLLATANQAQTEGSGSIATSSALGSKITNSDGASETSGPGSSAAGRGNQVIKSDGQAAAKYGTYEAALNVFANKETGVLLVRATGRQHKKIQEFIDVVMRAAKRQVLIETTIVEVQLSDEYKQGIDWSRALLGTKGFALSQTGTPGIGATAGALSVSYINPTSKFGDISSSVELLQKFGNVKVLSSPKLTVMNNQTASLKVANSKVYFTIKTTPAQFSPAGFMTSPATYDTTPNSVSVGLTMSVTPYISDTDTVTINVRPSISSVIGLGAKDPNPALANVCGAGVSNCNIPGIENIIPEIQTREIESIIKVENGQMAVMGGLIKEEMNKNTSQVPILGSIPIFGNLFQNREDSTTKTELVIFLRPVVIKDASMDGDFKTFSRALPTTDFFNEEANGNKP